MFTDWIHWLTSLHVDRLVAVLGTDVADLATRLAQRFDYSDNGSSLPRIAQFVAVMKGSGPLYDELWKQVGDWRADEIRRGESLIELVQQHIDRLKEN